MKAIHIFATTVAAFAISPIAHAQGAADSSELDSRPPLPTGACAGLTMLDPKKLETGGTIDLGKYYFFLRRPAALDAEMVSGGGGGGGASDTHDSWGGTGFGGGAGQYSFKRYRLDPGFYLIDVGAGGAGGRSLGRTVHATSGTGGGHTILAYCPSGLPVEILRGGDGGLADVHPGGGKSTGGDGTDLRHPLTGALIGKAGAGKEWGNDGADASGNGAGGGGEGGSRLPGGHGGSGSAGYAKLTMIGG